MDSLPPSQPAPESSTRSACPRRTSRSLKTPNLFARLIATLVVAVTMLLFAAPAFAAWGNNAPSANNLHNPQQRANARKKPRQRRPLASLACPAEFITSVIPDGHGGVWAASEDTGIYHGTITIHGAHHTGSPIAGSSPIKLTAAWKHYDSNNSPGLASNFITALCVDAKGRLWAGTNRHGISVFNGKKWQHYSILNGPLGCHIYAISFNQVANQIWVCTENGISIYQRGGNARGSAVLADSASGWKPNPHHIPRFAPRTWHYLTVANGLPSNPDSVSFDSGGRAFVGTQCGGLAIGTPESVMPVNLKAFLSSSPTRSVKYRWHILHGPWHTPTRPFGSGLPGNLINAVLVNQGNQVLVATDTGLAVSQNDGGSFRYQRGQDYAAKVQGLWHPPMDFRMPSQRFLKKLLPGDHITTVAEDEARNIWIGTWRNGFEVLNPRTQQSYRFTGGPATDGSGGGYVSAFCSIPIPQKAPAHSTGRPIRRDIRRETSRRPHRLPPLKQIMLVGYYGSGVWAFPKPIEGLRPRAATAAAIPQISSARHPRFPNPALPPTAGQLKALRPTLTAARKFSAHTRFPYAAFLRDDWATEGDWMARYGREYAVLCAAHYDLDFHVVCRDYASSASGMIGPHHSAGNSLREWEQWADTDNPRSLYIPQLGHRRETTWDDCGEVYPIAYQGPDVWVRVHLKNPGLYRVSMYFFNKDGHSGANLERDYPVEVYSAGSAFAKASTVPLLTARTFPTNRSALAWAQWAMRAKPLAEGRVVNFWGGVYLRFALAGPGQYMIRLDRNSGLDTIVQAVFIDRADAPATPQSQGPMADMGQVAYRSPAMPVDPSNALAPAISLWQAARHAFGPRGGANRRFARLLCYRFAAAHRAPANLLANWRWRLDLWTRGDRQVFDHRMNKAFRARLKGWKGLRQFMAKDGDLQSNSGEMGQ